MNALKLAVVAALTLGSGAAFANTQNARGQLSSESNLVDQAGAGRLVEGRATEQRLFGQASRPTIFGHDAEDSRYISSGHQVYVWGHPVDR